MRSFDVFSIEHLKNEMPKQQFNYSNEGLCSIYGVAMSQPMREDVIYVMSCFIG